MSVCTYCGRSNQESALYCHECGTELATESSAASVAKPPGASLTLPAPTLVDPAALAPAFSFQDGFHRADWGFIHRWIKSHISPEDLEQAWNEAALIWVTKLREDLGGEYRILQSPQTVLLCDRPLETVRWLLDYAGRAAVAVKDYLDRVAYRGGLGKNVLFIFSDEDDYYQYLAPHLSEGEQAASGGVCIHSGYIHIAFPWRDDFDTANAIMHELTHACLAHLPLPLW